jgi:hypothetical protein
MLAALVCGCAPFTQYIPLVDAPRPLQVHDAAQVQTFFVTPPARPHVDIGMLRAVAPDGTPEQMVALLRATAGQHGCDALLVTNVKVYDRGGSTGATVEGSCEVYIDAPTTTTSPPRSPSAGSPGASTPRTPS